MISGVELGGGMILTERLGGGYTPPPLGVGPISSKYNILSEDIDAQNKSCLIKKKLHKPHTCFQNFENLTNSCVIMKHK